MKKRDHEHEWVEAAKYRVESGEWRMVEQCSICKIKNITTVYEKEKQKVAD